MLLSITLLRFGVFHTSRLLLTLTSPGLRGSAAGSLRGSSQGCAPRHRGLGSARPGSREARSSSPNSRTFSPSRAKHFSWRPGCPCSSLHRLPLPLLCVCMEKAQQQRMVQPSAPYRTPVRGGGQWRSRTASPRHNTGFSDKIISHKTKKKNHLEGSVPCLQR